MAKISKLLGGDIGEYSPAQAGAAFADEVNRMVREDGLDLTKAWSKAKMLHPETHARMCEAANPTSAVANEGYEPSLPPVPFAGKLFHLQAFHMPVTTPNEYFEVAWRANGNQSVRVNSEKIFSALVVHMAKTQNVSIAVAKSQVIDTFPALARQAGQAPDKELPSDKTITFPAGTL